MAAHRPTRARTAGTVLASALLGAGLMFLFLRQPVANGPRETDHERSGGVVEEDAAGRFQLAHLPDGKYTLAAWHPKLGPIAGREVVVAQGASAPLVLDFSPAVSAELRSAESP